LEKTDRIEALMKKGVEGNVFPGAVVLVANRGRIIFFHAVGHGSLIPHVTPIYKDTIFDLASLSKPLATCLSIMFLVDSGILHLDQALADVLPLTLPKDKRAITVRQILIHSGGFADWKPFYLEIRQPGAKEGKEALRDRLLRLPLAYEPLQTTLYSDLGFMVLEWVIEESAGKALDWVLARHFYEPLGLTRTFLSKRDVPSGFSNDQFAATEDCPWRKRVIRGEVHDENAFAVGGYSGHAGLFGTAEEVYVLVDLLRAHYRGERADYLKPETVRTFFTRQGLVPGSTWALGWDTPSPGNSSSGRYLSTESVGHLGFCGTSLWMDLRKDVIIIFLTNRIHPTRNNEKIKAYRPVLHDAIMEDLRLS
jgi:CubicO group peptidase (beta-lactamase class C family)